MTDTNATTVDLGFYGSNIVDATNLVLAFSKFDPKADEKALAWRVIEIPKDTSLRTSVKYTAQLGVACANYTSGIVTAAGATKTIEVGYSIDLIKKDGRLVWGDAVPIGNSGSQEDANILIYNKTEAEQDVAIVLFDQSDVNKPPLPLLWNKAPAKPGVAKFTFKPTLRAYFAQNYTEGQVIDSHVVAQSEFDKDLSKMGGKPYTYRITEIPKTTRYTITEV